VQSPTAASTVASPLAPACANSGVCRSVYMRAVCDCPRGYYGPSCALQDAVDDCPASRCCNGVCRDLYQAAECEVRRSGGNAADTRRHPLS
jgi:hypothetical protein